MTALEHLTEVFEDQNGKGEVPGRAFFKKTVAPALLDTLNTVRPQASTADESAAVDKAAGKVNDLNRMTLQDSIELMLRAYGVPLTGLAGTLPNLIKLRNDIVHNGIARKQFQPELQHHINVVRELLTRIFLKLLNFSGNYHSYLSGKEEWVQFPGN